MEGPVSTTTETKNQSQVLTETVESLSMARDLPSITRVVADAARALTGSDGSTFVLRENDKCYYADENAISPLWKGHRFPLQACISGWSMLNKQVVVIEDIYKDPRIPHDAYRPTFVKSLCMVPIRDDAPLGSIGNYWASGYVPTPEQIRLLQVLANSAAIALENLELRQDILRRASPEDEIADRQREFERAIHTLAHDLRNPISTMMLVAEVLHTKLHDTVDARTAGYFDSMLKTGRRATDQIQRMLSLYSATHRSLERREVDLTEMATEISEQLRAQAPARKIDFEIARGLHANADPVLIRLAMENLLSNAVKYTGKKPAATIQFRRLGEHSSTFLVRDNGDGFDPAQSAQLFRPLVRLHNDAAFPGTGLGLASVARIIELHGGHVRAEGQKSVGATFYFDLPPVA